MRQLKEGLQIKARGGGGRDIRGKRRKVIVDIKGQRPKHKKVIKIQDRGCSPHSVGSFYQILDDDVLQAGTCLMLCPL